MTEREIETIVISKTSKEDSSKKKCRFDVRNRLSSFELLTENEIEVITLHPSPSSFTIHPSTSTLSPPSSSSSLCPACNPHHIEVNLLILYHGETSNQ
jgi:hypothetical protein